MPLTGRRFRTLKSRRYRSQKYLTRCHGVLVFGVLVVLCVRAVLVSRVHVALSGLAVLVDGVLVAIGGFVMLVLEVLAALCGLVKLVCEEDAALLWSNSSHLLRRYLRARVCCISALPCAVASIQSSRAHPLFTSEPSPSKYIRARSRCASAWPCAAAFPQEPRCLSKCV